MVRGHTPITFTWSQNGVPILPSKSPSGIRIQKNEEGNESVLVVEVANRDHASVYTCQASNAFGVDAKTFFVNVVENPDPPAHVHVVRVTSREVSLAWAPPFDGNSPLTHYVVRYWVAKSDYQTRILNKTVDADKTQDLIQALSPGTQYHVQVVAVNKLGSSSPSPTLSITTQLEPPSTPPVAVTAISSKEGVLTVSWQPPSGEYTSVHVNGYQIGYRLDRSTDDYSWRSVRSSSTSIDIIGLQHYTTYEVTVRAVNDVGTGPMSPPVKATTIQAEPSVAPGNIECTPLSSQALRIRWNSIPVNKSHGTIQGYKVVFKKLSNMKGSSRAETKRTTNLETNLQGLEQYSNFSIKVLAFNAAGDGKISSSVYCSTLQDKPGAPGSIKALTAGERSVLVTWLRPQKPNGIITHYTLYYRPINAHQGTSSLTVKEHSSTYWEEIEKLVDGLDAHSHYQFWVKAATRIGEGATSNVVSQSPGKTIAARIKSFGQEVEGIAGKSLTLPCNVIGQPPPSVIWSPPVVTLPDNSLRFTTLHPHEAVNYTCTAYNIHGRDEQTWMVKIISTPSSPTVHIQYTTENTIHLSWTLKANGGKPLTGFIVSYKEANKDPTERNEWSEREVEPNETRYVLRDMKCGTTYNVRIFALNSIGRGRASQVVTTRTRGSVPRSPRSQDLVSVNSTAITLHLYTWPSGGCMIQYFLVTHRKQSSNGFETPARLPGTIDTYTLRDLTPLTWYDVKIISFNSAGSSTVLYHVATPSVTGATLAPEMIVEVEQIGLKVPYYLDPHVLAPIVSGIACTLALLLCVAIGISRGMCVGNQKNKKVIVQTSESKSSLFFKRSLQESNEDLSPAAKAKHEEAYRVEDSTYEICPYATFKPPPLGSPFPGTPTQNHQEADIMDYSLQFQTFGHQECLEGQQPSAISSGGAPSSSSSSGWFFLKGRGREKSGSSKKTKRRSGEIRCISNDQTLPIGSSNLERNNKTPRPLKEEGGEEANRCSDDSDNDDEEEEDVGDNTRQYVRGSQVYRLPIKLKIGQDFSFHPPDSSTESNEERSPQPPRRPPHMKQHQVFSQQKQEANKKSNPVHPQPRRHLSQPYPQSVIKHPIRSNTCESIYSVDGKICNLPSKESSDGVPLRPPSRFVDNKEFSEAECDREQNEKKPKGGRNARVRHSLSSAAQTGNDYSIHV